MGDQSKMWQKNVILNGQILDGIEFEYTKECKKIYKTREGAII